QTPTRGCAECLKAEDGFRIELETAVEAGEVVVPLDEIVARGNEAERIFTAEVALQAQDADISVLVKEAVRVGAEQTTPSLSLKLKALLIVGNCILTIILREVAGRVV